MRRDDSVRLREKTCEQSQKWEHMLLRFTDSVVTKCVEHVSWQEEKRGHVEFSGRKRS